MERHTSPAGLLPYPNGRAPALNVVSLTLGTDLSRPEIVGIGRTARALGEVARLDSARFLPVNKSPHDGDRCVFPCPFGPESTP
jgi:hypothetical protein